WLFLSCLKFFMIIRSSLQRFRRKNNTTSKTATRSSVNNRGYERSEHPPDSKRMGITSTLKESPHEQMGHSFRVLSIASCCPQVLWTLRLLSEDAFSVLVVRFFLRKR
ncbi:MAG: hypothetical protein IJT97_11775, partial [Bacteroidaceae bacterium]|nr:hypothetical protein [Bacteroidaceae bacterium]